MRWSPRPVPILTGVSPWWGGDEVTPLSAVEGAALTIGKQRKHLS